MPREVNIELLLGRSLYSVGYDGSERDLILNNKDSILFNFLISKTSEEGDVPKDMTGVTSFQVMVADGYDPDTATIYASQDLYNEGYNPTNEVPASGLMTSMVALNTAALDNALRDSSNPNDFIEVVYFLRADDGNGAATLWSEAGYIYDQPNEVNSGTPVPNTLDYYTKNEILALIQIFKQTGEVDGTAIAQTEIYTVPVGKRFVITDMKAIFDSAAWDGANPYVQFGTTADPDLLDGPYQPSATTDGDMDNTTGAFPVLNAGDVLEFGITTGSTHSTCVVIGAVEGYLIPA